MENNYTILIPGDLHLEQLLEDNPPSFKYHVDYFYAILNYLLLAPTYRDEDEYDYGYIELSSKILKSIVSNYNDYISYLLKVGIIISDNHYIKSAKCKGYLLSERYLFSVEVFTLQKVGLRKRLSKQMKSYELLTTSVRHLSKWLFNHHLSIDYEGAVKYINAKMEVALTTKERRKYHMWLVQVKRIRFKMFYAIVDNNVGRLHSNLVNIKKELRNFICYGDQSLVSVDVKSSQPLLLCAVLKERFYEPKDDGRLTVHDFLTEPKSTYSSTNNIKSPKSTHKSLLKINYKIINITITYIMFLKISQSTEIDDITREIESGDFYEIFGAFLRENGIDPGDRNAIKRKFYQVLFTCNRFISQNGAIPKALFKNRYPDVYNIICLFKSKNKVTLPCLLQKMESEMILNYCSKRFSKLHPDVPMFTIHDSIVVPIGYEETVKTIIEEEFFEKLGVIPKVKPEYWQVEKAA